MQPWVLGRTPPMVHFSWIHKNRAKAWVLPSLVSAGGAGGRRRHLGDGVPLPEREVPSPLSLFPRLPPQAAQERYLNRYGKKMKNTFVILWAPGPAWVVGKTVREQPYWTEHAAFMDQLFCRATLALE
jgi:hypothetical protein